MLRKMPFVLLIVILSVLFFDRFLSLEFKSCLYAVSLSIKSLIIFLLPILIFGLLFKAAVKLAHNATKVIILILALICCSNFLSTMISQYVGIWVYHFDLSIVLPKDLKGLSPYWSFDLPKLIANDKAMFAGLILGIVSTLM